MYGSLDSRTSTCTGAFGPISIVRTGILRVEHPVSSLIHIHCRSTWLFSFESFDGRFSGFRWFRHRLSPESKNAPHNPREQNRVNFTALRLRGFVSPLKNVFVLFDHIVNALQELLPTALWNQFHAPGHFLLEPLKMPASSRSLIRLRNSDIRAFRSSSASSQSISSAICRVSS